MNELDGFRAEIDRIDTELARLLELRFDLCEEIGRYKRMNGLPIENCEREKELVAARTEGMLSHRSDAVAVFRMIIRRAKRIQKEKLNLYLVGMPGSGKSRTARRLARAIEKPVADTDKLIIDKQGMSIDEIFDTHGEAFFREIESETLLGVAERGGHVVATGGGILTVERNIPIIKGSGIVVFLNRDISILLNAKTANRPLIRGGREAVLKLYAEIPVQAVQRYKNSVRVVGTAAQRDQHGTFLQLRGNIYKGYCNFSVSCRMAGRCQRHDKRNKKQNCQNSFHEKRLLKIRHR